MGTERGGIACREMRAIQANRINQRTRRFEEKRQRQEQAGHTELKQVGQFVLTVKADPKCHHCGKQDQAKRTTSRSTRRTAGARDITGPPERSRGDNMAPSKALIACVQFLSLLLAM